MGGVADIKRRKLGFSISPNSEVEQRVRAEYKDIIYKETKLRKLFKINSSKKIFHAQNVQIYESQVPNSHPYVVRSASNNGIRGYIKENKVVLNSGNSMSFAQDTFSVFYQEKPYFTGNKVKVLTSNYLQFNKINAIYFVGAINYALENLTWGTGSTVESIGDFSVSLPIHSDGEIAFDYMEAYIQELEALRIQELEALRIQELEAYLKATGLNNYILTQEEQDVLQCFRAEQSIIWKMFKVGDLFDIRPTKNYNMTNNELMMQRGYSPVVTNSSSDNGISGYIEKPTTESGNMITFSDTTTDESIFYQPNDFVGYSHVQGLYPKTEKENWNAKTLLYLVTTFRRAVRGKYNYGIKFNRRNAKNESIALPICSDGKIAFDLMSQYVGIIEKLIIRGVVEWKDKQIEATKEVVKKSV